MIISNKQINTKINSLCDRLTSRDPEGLYSIVYSGLSQLDYIHVFEIYPRIKKLKVSLEKA